MAMCFRVAVTHALPTVYGRLHKCDVESYLPMVDSCCLCRLAEYAIIPHLNVMGAAAVVDYMYVEWHTWFGSVSPKQKEIASMARAAMQAAGTTLSCVQLSSMIMQRGLSILGSISPI